MMRHNYEYFASIAVVFHAYYICVDCNICYIRFIHTSIIHRYGKQLLKMFRFSSIRWYIFKHSNSHPLLIRLRQKICQLYYPKVWLMLFGRAIVLFVDGWSCFKIRSHSTTRNFLHLSTASTKRSVILACQSITAKKFTFIWQRTIKKGTIFITYVIGFYIFCHDDISENFQQRHVCCGVLLPDMWTFVTSFLCLWLQSCVPIGGAWSQAALWDLVFLFRLNSAAVKYNTHTPTCTHTHTYYTYKHRFQWRDRRRNGCKSV